MGVLFNTIIALLVAALVLVIVSRFNLGLTLRATASAIIAAIVIAVVAGVINWLLGLLGITIGGGLLGAIVWPDRRGCGPDAQRQVPARDGSQRLQRGHHRSDRHRGRDLAHRLAARSLRHRDLRPVG